MTLIFILNNIPVKGYASHGESWSVALSVKIGAYQIMENIFEDDPISFNIR